VLNLSLFFIIEYRMFHIDLLHSRFNKFNNCNGILNKSDYLTRRNNLLNKDKLFPQSL
jgi:hypothetical protein